MDFDSFYQSHYGERWPALKGSILEVEAKTSYRNPFASEFSQGDRDEKGVLTNYVMSTASQAVVESIEVLPKAFVLDACAAPGGKALFLYARVLQAGGKMIWNEPSESRRQRMKQVIRQYIPENKRQDLQVTGKPAPVFGKTHINQFSLILADAPCSSERHFVENNSELELWTVGRTKKLSRQQGSILKGLWHSLKENGTLVYSTCSISPHENDEVIATFLKDHPDAITQEVLPKKINFEKTKFGWQIFPDLACGAGPIFCAHLKKLAPSV